MKICSKCKIEKEESFFYRNTRFKDDLFPQCKECNCSIRKERYQLNKDEELALDKARHQKDPSKRKQKNIKRKDKIKVAAKQYYIKNKRKIYVASLRRKAKIKRATLSGYDKEILEIYQNRPDGFHVDHIVPLQGETVSGLHVPWNLQYLTIEENLSKGNKLV
jgi:phage terminase large subunit GpA-like protein